MSLVPNESLPGTRPSRALFANGALMAGVFYVVLYGVYAAYDPGALSLATFTDLMNNAAPLALAAAGQTIVVLTRGFDLSLAGTISIVSVFMAVFPMEDAGGGAASFAACLAIGGAIGAVSGLLVAFRGIQSIAATLGVMIVCQGIALLILNAPGGAVAEWVSYEMTDVVFGFAPASGLVVLAFALAWLLLRKTDLGLSLYAIGADEGAAGLSGVPVARRRFWAYVLAGACYGAAGFMLSAQTATGDPNAGMPFLLLSFASVALGGTSLTGGQGGVVGSLIGACVLMLMQKVLFAAGVSSFYIGASQGALLILAILFGRLVSRAASSGDAK
ncbi:ABC transporter permease [Hansschlegelia plantiphila]|uniref:ABC transporter permease n=1 Tax=Hansschlegelia plantiphila TaxID=374655 RepID=A0A9W6MUP9_9HYPH|nr:ABC transporter permease [Hansschlegelia plantiphila]GLK67614.1 hypothetical protein GCM10008179_12520 [Hansschlegelia plantiphila]